MPRSPKTRAAIMEAIDAARAGGFQDIAWRLEAIVFGIPMTHDNLPISLKAQEETVTSKTG